VLDARVTLANGLRMELCQSWEQDDYIDVDALAEAIDASARALKIAATVVREDKGGDDEEEDIDEAQLDGRIVISSCDSNAAIDIIRLDVRAPVDLRGAMRFTGYGLEFDAACVEGPWEPFYLFFAHLATALGARPEALDADDEESTFLDEVRSWIDACVDDHLTEASIEPGTIPIAIEASPGVLGRFQLDWRRDASGLVLDIRGAGTDLRVTVGGRLLELSELQIEPMIEVLRGELLTVHAEERALALGKSAPAANPAYGGKVVLHVWVDGVCARSEILDESRPLRDTLERAAREGALDVVRYFSNGAPLLRSVETDLGDHHQSIASFERSCTWRWSPDSTDEAARVFHEVARLMPSRRDTKPAPAPDPDQLTLRRWLREFQRISGKLGGVSVRKLLVADAEEGGFIPDHWTADTSPQTWELVNLLWAVEALARDNHEWEQHQGWLLTGEWYDDSTDGFIEGLEAMLGLPSPPDLPERTPDEPDDNLEDEYLAACNAAAARLGLEERLFPVKTLDTEASLVIKLSPATFDALTSAGLLFAHVPVGTAPPSGFLQKAGALWARLKKWN
jgi:hypothetical protein